MRAASFVSNQLSNSDCVPTGHTSTKAFRRQRCTFHCSPNWSDRVGHRKQHRVQASSEGSGIPEEEITGSPAWHTRKRGRTLPSLARTPEQTFVLAGVLKILLLATTFPAAYIFTPLGRTPRGVTAYLLLIPFGILLSYLAAALTKANVMRRKWSGVIVVLAASLLMTGLGYFYDVRPLPPPRPATAQPAEKEDLFRSASKKTGADSDKIWRQLEKDGLV